MKTLLNDETVSQVFVEDLTDFEIKHLISYEYKPHRYAFKPEEIISFDIETSSFYDGEDKRAIPYIWMMGIGVEQFTFLYGRTWDSFIRVINAWKSFNRPITIWVHNLSFEFSFMKDYFEWDMKNSLFRAKQHPIYVTTGKIKFRCTYALSNASLSTVAKNLITYDVAKKCGDLDYDLLRTPETPMDDTEIGYCINDVRIPNAYIKEKLQTYKKLSKIPNTSTAEVRMDVRQAVLNNEIDNQIVHDLKLDSRMFEMIQWAYVGGHTHADTESYGNIYENVTSFDFTSSYPTTLIAEKYPMYYECHITGTKNCLDLLYKLDKDHAFLAYIYVRRAINKVEYDATIPTYKCKFKNYDKSKSINGKLLYGEDFYICLTDVALGDFLLMYDVEFAFEELYVWRYSYLPKGLIDKIIKYYYDKTTLKGIEGKEVEYMMAKAKINGIYGDFVKNPLNDIITYSDGEYHVEKRDIEDALDEYNNQKNRYNWYGWGVWCTSYARHNLFTGIREFKHDYLYADTDSLKVINVDKHMDYIEQYNRDIINKLTKACNYHGINPDLIIHPKDKKGNEHPLGVWDCEGTFEKFMTLGAKRYVKVHDGHFEFTIAGVPKAGCQYLLETYGNKIWEVMVNGFHIPKEHSGKLTHTYIDGGQVGEVKDYMGKVYNYNQLSGTHLEKQEYDGCIASDIRLILMGLKYKLEGKGLIDYYFKEREVER